MLFFYSKILDSGTRTHKQESTVQPHVMHNIILYGSQRISDSKQVELHVYIPHWSM